MSEPGEVAAARVLVVEDNRLNRMKLVRAVEELGHQVEAAEDGASALEMLADHPFDAVLLDIVMPGMDGLEVLSRMKADPRLRDIPAVVISSLEESDSAVRCIEMGAEDYLTKPFDPVLLRARLRSSLRRKQLTDLEAALRDQEKLASLGRLAARVAHEVNNPVSAALRNLDQVSRVVEQLAVVVARVGGWGRLGELLGGREEGYIDPLRRADRESELEQWMEAAGVEAPWDRAAALVASGVTLADLERALDGLEREEQELAATLAADTATLRHLVTQAHQALARVPPIVASLKSYTYMDQTPEQDVDVRQGLESTISMLSSKIPPGVEVRRSYPEQVPPVRGVGGELNQVWTNLIDNAVAAVGDHGVIEVAVEVGDGEVAVTVTDTGPGIPEEAVERLFDPTYTTKPRGEGTGLGLAIAHAIVRRHRGRIEVESQPGRTFFRVVLPPG